MLVRLTVAMLVVLTLAGCTEDASDAADAREVPDATGEGRIDVLDFGTPVAAVVESFSGRFEFTDNQQYGHLVRDQVGGSEPTRVHDISSLLPPSGAYEVHVVARADPGDGDIDVWFEGEGIAAWRCECPFGGANDAFGYGMVERGDVSVRIQYDEVHEDPNEAGLAVQGFDYTLDVTVQPLVRAMPPGVPLAVELDALDRLVIQNHTHPVTIFTPDDRVAAVLQPGSGEFAVGNESAAGEYVVIQQENGAPFEVAIHHGDDTPRQGRVLRLTGAAVSQSLSGNAVSETFEVPANVLHLGVCLYADTTADYEWEIEDPNGDTWLASDGTLTILFGDCRGTWRGTPDMVGGTWTLEGTQAFGQNVVFEWWYDTYRR